MPPFWAFQSSNWWKKKKARSQYENMWKSSQSTYRKKSKKSRRRKSSKNSLRSNKDLLRRTGRLLCWIRRSRFWRLKAKKRMPYQHVTLRRCIATCIRWNQKRKSSKSDRTSRKLDQNFRRNKPHTKKHRNKRRSTIRICWWRLLVKAIVTGSS